MEDGVELDEQINHGILISRLVSHGQIELFQGESSEKLEDYVVDITTQGKLLPDGGPPDKQG